MPRFWLASVLIFSLLVVHCGSGEPPKPEARQGDDKKKRDASIPELIKRLGSSEFREREAATRALTAIGFPAVDTLREAAHSGDAEVARRANQLVGIIENSLEQLLADYRKYGLPLPPKDAGLIRFVSGGGGFINDKRTPLTYLLGFVLEPATKDSPPLLLVGTQKTRLDAGTQFELVEPRLDVLKDVSPCWYFHSPFEKNAGLAIALQCKARGWADLARELWTLSIKSGCGHHFGTFQQRANLPNRVAVAHLAWAQYGNELVEPNSDRAAAARQMNGLLLAEPSLNTEGNQALLRSLQAALVPSSAKSGSVERLIDDLVDMADNNRNNLEKDPRYFRLAHMGFAAVPALIEHLDDERLTRSLKQGFNNFPTWILRVQHVVTGLLQELAGQDVGTDWLRRQQGWAADKVEARKWWEQARKIGQERYFLAHVLPEDPKNQWPNNLMLSIIADKYPQHLPKLYRTVLEERSYMQSWPLAEAVSGSSLPTEKKLELFLQASHHKDLEHRRVGFRELRKLDAKQFMKLLLATLEALPRTPTEPYWKCPEAALAHLVLDTDDPRAWTALERVAKRSDIGLRMEFMNPMNYTRVGGRNRMQRLAFLSAFLDDTAERDAKSDPKMFQGPHAGFTFRRLSVRDFAAMQIASILEMPGQPEPEWTLRQWQELHNRVRKALDRQE